MKKLKKPNLFFGVLIISFIIIGYLVFAWTEPTLSPPQGNVPASLNTSLNAQAKEGALVVGNNSSVTTGLIVRYGNVGIGTTAPATKLEVQGGALCVRSGSSVSCNTTSGAISAQYFYYISDLRLKTNIQPIENALSRLLTVNGISYQTKYENNRSLGLIAQDVERVFPEVVNTDKEMGLKWIDYGKLVPVLIEAVKEQQREIEKLKIEIESLEIK